MPLITFISHDGTTKKVSAETGCSLMQVAVENDIDVILAECSGACSCATCHCYVDETWADRVGEPGDIEKYMLDCVSEQTPLSRLSCQIEITDLLDGLVVRLPESQY